MERLLRSFAIFTEPVGELSLQDVLYYHPNTTPDGVQLRQVGFCLAVGYLGESFGVRNRREVDVETEHGMLGLFSPFPPVWFALEANVWEDATRLQRLLEAAFDWFCFRHGQSCFRRGCSSEWEEVRDNNHEKGHIKSMIQEWGERFTQALEEGILSWGITSRATPASTPARLNSSLFYAVTPSWPVLLGAEALLGYPTRFSRKSLLSNGSHFTSLLQQHEIEDESFVYVTVERQDFGILAHTLPNERALRGLKLECLVHGLIPPNISLRCYLAFKNKKNEENEQEEVEVEVEMKGVVQVTPRLCVFVFVAAIHSAGVEELQQRAATLATITTAAINNNNNNNNTMMQTISEKEPPHAADLRVKHEPHQNPFDRFEQLRAQLRGRYSNSRLHWMLWNPREGGRIAGDCLGNLLPDTARRLTQIMRALAGCQTDQPQKKKKEEKQKAPYRCAAIESGMVQVSRHASGVLGLVVHGISELQTCLNVAEQVRGWFD